MDVKIHAEYPTDENLSRLDNVDFPVDVFVASRSLHEFKELERQILHTYENVKSVGYWPLLSVNEGYWVSPWSDERSLDRVFGEIREGANPGSPLLVMLDLEPPFFMNKCQMIRGLSGFNRKKKKIGKMLEDKCDSLRLISLGFPDYLVPGTSFIKELLGLEFEGPGTEKVNMFYSSFANYAPHLLSQSSRAVVKGLLRREVRKGLQTYGDRFGIGLGCLHTGALGNEPLLRSEEFKEDLDIVRIAGVQNVYVYSLDGINPDNAQIIRDYAERGREDEK